MSLSTFAGLPLDRPLMMGIVNVTPDSFSDGGDFATTEAAVVQGQRLLEEGADILDIGGESTRPRAATVGTEEELSRVIPVIEKLRDTTGAVISIDTRHVAVMSAAVKEGATIINDVSGLREDGALQTVAELGVSVVLMHMLGEPGYMQTDPRYGDVVAEVKDYCINRAMACKKAGIAHEKIAIDPGIGFGKTVRHNLDLIAQINTFTQIGYPVLVGVSRKSFIGGLCGEKGPKARMTGSIAAALALLDGGVQILRVHDVAATRQAVMVWQAIQEHRASKCVNSINEKMFG